MLCNSFEKIDNLPASYVHIVLQYAGMAEPGGRGLLPVHPQILAEMLTLSQLGGADYAPPPSLNTQSCIKGLLMVRNFCL